MADLSSEKDILFLSHLRIVEYLMSLDTSRLKVTFAAFENNLLICWCPHLVKYMKSDDKYNAVMEIRNVKNKSL